MVMGITPINFIDFFDRKDRWYFEVDFIFDTHYVGMEGL